MISARRNRLMDDVVLVPIPVSREAAKALADDRRRARVGQLVSDLLRPPSPDRDPLALLIAEVKTEARAGGLTDEEVDAELRAYNAERRT
jgi:hypothetical protein